jgi:hypothetical protein
MSIDRPTLDDFATDADESEPDWQPQQRDGRQQANTCQACGSHVSADFARVSGDNDDRVWACHSCVDQNAILRGAAADPDHEFRYGDDR